ncbi:hypothetical protein CRI93_09340 [Longimonas halophila]|uniref:Uncharacterized protein n=1 Tax=Longimonas halophila TaxID=1469170 RepID=A0A2H3NZN4_9BACT|nr:hypothetical protein [Longimonas halophila]PEN06476.1 hypothetical protein CRI93_09340 [Longimonas halophila]
MAILNQNDAVYFIGALAKIGLDYVRWTQLVPMLIGWFLAFAFTLPTLYGGVIAFLQDALLYAARLPMAIAHALILQAAEEEMATQAVDTLGALALNASPVLSQAAPIIMWLLTALGMWAAHTVWIAVFGTRRTRSLRQRLVWLFWAIVGYMAFVQLGLWTTAAPEELGDPNETRFVLLVITPILLTGVSVWGLVVSTIVDGIQKPINRWVTTHAANDSLTRSESVRQ